MRQRWNDLLFAHWPIPPQVMQAKIPPGLELDTFDGSAWLGVVPFWMNQIDGRTIGSHALRLPLLGSFAELNLRTYVRSPRTGKRGVLFFALECENPFTVLGARTLFQLPYFPAKMRHAEDASGFTYSSRRQLTSRFVRVEATYRPSGAVVAEPDELARFLTERYCLFTTFAGRVFRGDIHHLPWPLQAAEAEFCVNELPAAHGFELPPIAPVLHFSRQLEVYIWPLEQDQAVS